jgi:hypothetical protein
MNQRRKRKNFARNGIKLAGSKVIKITVRRWTNNNNKI